MDQPAAVYSLEASRFPALSVFSTWFGLFFILMIALAHGLMPSPQQSAATAPVLQIFQMLLIALILASVLYLALHLEGGLRMAALPLVINMGTLLLALLVPYDALWSDLRFEWHSQQYKLVVHMVETGSLTPDENGVAQLPPIYRALSPANGRIWIAQTGSETAVFFPTSFSYPGKFTGYYYHSANKPPQPGAFMGQWHTVIPKRPYWFYCMSDG